MAISEEIVNEYFDDKHNNALKVIERINDKLKIIFTMLSLLISLVMPNKYLESVQHGSTPQNLHEGQPNNGPAVFPASGPRLVRLAAP